MNKSLVHFYWVAGCPVYGITVLALSDIAGATLVEIAVTETACHLEAIAQKCIFSYRQSRG
jgi:hypothetical protein